MQASQILTEISNIADKLHVGNYLSPLDTNKDQKETDK